MSRQQVTHRGRKDVNDLAADIISRARADWQAPTRDAYHDICWGSEFEEPCPHRWECHPVQSSRQSGRGPRYDRCLKRRIRLRRELMEFFHSDWFGFLLGSVEPELARKGIGVPEMEEAR